jgi:hypothetical protein
MQSMELHPFLRFNNPYKIIFSLFPFMSEKELDEMSEDDIDPSTANDGEMNEDKTPSDEEEITREDALAWKHELEKARKKIAHLSKDKKTIEKAKDSPKDEPKPLDDETLDDLLDRRDFYKKNSEAKELKGEIEQLFSASNGKFSREEIYAKLSGDDEVEENRKVYGKSSVSGKQGAVESFAAVTIDAYDKMSPATQKAYNAASKEKFGGVKFKD